MGRASIMPDKCPDGDVMNASLMSGGFCLVGQFIVNCQQGAHGSSVGKGCVIVRLEVRIPLHAMDLVAYFSVAGAQMLCGKFASSVIGLIRSKEMRHHLGRWRQ